MKAIKNWIRSSVPERVKKFLVYSDEVEYGKLSFSQFGEDMVLSSLLPDKPDGFYVDIGAHHPVKCSNTYFLYKRGWNGIAIDPLPGFKDIFAKRRPGDIVLELGIAESPGEIDYFCFQQPLENTFSADMAKRKIDLKVNHLKEIIKVKVFPLDEILDQYLPPNTKIDLLSIDAEGYDLMILRSNNWQKYQPEVIVVENLNNDPESIGKDSITEYLKPLGYRLHGVLRMALFYVRS